MNSVDAINLNLLPALVLLLDEKSVTGAARRAGVTQSAMSHSLARLREALGDRLLVNAGRAWVLTPRAKLLAERVPSLLGQLTNSLRPRAPFDPTTAERTFRIATFDFFEFTALPDLLAVLSAGAPNVRLEVLRFGPRSLAEVTAGDVDLALVAANMAAPMAGLCQRSLGSDPFCVIAREGHPALRKKLSLDAYLSLGHVLVSLESKRDGVVDRALAARDLARTVALRVQHFSSAALAVAHSDLVCTLTRSVAERARAMLDLQVFEPPIALPDAKVVALWSKSLDADPAHQWLRATVAGLRATRDSPAKTPAKTPQRRRR